MIILNFLLFSKWSKKKKKSAWIQTFFDPSLHVLIFYKPFLPRTMLCFYSLLRFLTHFYKWLLWVLALNVLSVEPRILPFTLGFLQRMLSSSSASVLGRGFPALAPRGGCSSARRPWLTPTVLAPARGRHRVPMLSDAACLSPQVTLAHIPVFQHSLWLSLFLDQKCFIRNW